MEKIASVRGDDIPSGEEIIIGIEPTEDGIGYYPVALSQPSDGINVRCSYLLYPGDEHLEARPRTRRECVEVIRSIWGKCKTYVEFNNHQ